MEHGMKAAELFMEGYNCAQAVAVAFCDVTGMEPKFAAKIASSFGGGMGRLREVYPNIMKLSYDNTRTRMRQSIDGAREVQRKSPLELFGELYEQQNNQPMSERQLDFTRELIESIWEVRQ